jgi:pSer/pThr/pTyr-binding forkhead associated (FHA) protein
MGAKLFARASAPGSLEQLPSLSQPPSTAAAASSSPIEPNQAAEPAMSSPKTGMWTEGFPLVGWLVPLNGRHEFQTFKLQDRTTKIGTAAPSDVVINDGFMSTEHCRIVRSPQGFLLQDNKSTNGCWVNDHRVDQHDLVDNDMITLGKTNLKFKSVS